MPDTFNDLRSYIVDYLYERGINPQKRFHCLNPEHLDRDPSMGYDAKRQKVHCFACGADYDLFDLLAIDENLTSPSDALALASKRYGHGNAATTRPSDHPSGEAPSESYLDRCFSHRKETDYFTRRGLSDATVTKFRLGYDPTHDCVVLPCENGRCVRRSVAEKRYLNEKGQPSPLFQPELLTAAGEGPVFLLEGTFDALSAEELGYQAAALNGAGNREKAAALLRSLDKPAPILLLTDNDAAGNTWATALTEEFPWLYRCPDVPIGKDLNEFLCADRAGAARFLAQAVADQKTQEPPPYAETSAAGQMAAFRAYIDEQAKRPALKTGFDGLDQALDGGFYDGLYVIGAVSSLGKTAFCMQIADQLAMQGRDVLIFSLEMMTWELMARSISRESFRLDTTSRRRFAKTARGVLDGRRWEQYSAQETAHLEQAQTAYTAYAGHLFFREGDHETGLGFIQTEVARHIAETGQKPVVLIDYLQIIAPVDVHFTDKQNLDRIVCALKKLSRQHGLTILAISSFNRENYNLEVSMNAFKESGGIDYSADVLLGLQARGAGRPGFSIDEEKRKDPRELELKILKNRFAALGRPIPFRYYPAFSYFEEG